MKQIKIFWNYICNSRILEQEVNNWLQEIIIDSIKLSVVSETYTEYGNKPGDLIAHSIYTVLIEYSTQ